jgi:hypothetical protein
MVNPGERAYQLERLWSSKCPGCKHCAQILMEHPDVVKLTCHVCGSSCEPNRPWKRLAFAVDSNG